MSLSLFSGSTDTGSHLVEPDLQLLAAAPDDEVLGEILVLQSELAQQMIFNRRAVNELLAKALKDLPAQQEAAKRREAAEKDMDAWVEVRDSSCQFTKLIRAFVPIS
eukprot:scaffold105556_cov42-Prasinocladus_malaysianus.AAC.2